MAPHISCGVPKRHTFLGLLVLCVMSPLSNHLHRFCENDDQTFQNNALNIATWPQYATSSESLRLEGYGYAVPKCATSGSLASYASWSTSNLTGSHVTYVWNDLPQAILDQYRDLLAPHINHTLMPPDYLSYSVRDAQVVLTFPNHDADQHNFYFNESTNGYGHFKPDIEGSLLASPNATADPYDYYSDDTTNDYGHFDTIIDAPLPAEGTVVKANLRLSHCKDYNTPSTEIEIHKLNETGLSIVSDVDDVLRAAEIWSPHKMFRNLFFRHYRALPNMPEVYAAWRDAVPGAHFHYYSDAPEMSHHFYVNGTQTFYPPGTFGFRPMQADTIGNLTAPRYNHIKKLVGSVPKHTFVLVGDTATGSVLSAYGSLARKFPGSVQCVFLLNKGRPNWIVPNLKQLPDNFRLFQTPNDLLRATNLLQALGDGYLAGCGDLPAVDPEVPRYGNIASWYHTIRSGVMAYMYCFLMFEFRPTDGSCPFD